MLMHPIPDAGILQDGAFEKPQRLVMAGEESPGLDGELIPGLTGVVGRYELSACGVELVIDVLGNGFLDHDRSLFFNRCYGAGGKTTPRSGRMEECYRGKAVGRKEHTSTTVERSKTGSHHPDESFMSKSDADRPGFCWRSCSCTAAVRARKSSFVKATKFGTS